MFLMLFATLNMFVLKKSLPWTTVIKEFKKYAIQSKVKLDEINLIPTTGKRMILG